MILALTVAAVLKTCPALVETLIYFSRLFTFSNSVVKVLSLDMKTPKVIKIELEILVHVCLDNTSIKSFEEVASVCSRYLRFLFCIGIGISVQIC